MISEAYASRGKYWRRRLTVLGVAVLATVVVAIASSSSTSRLVPHTEPARAAPAGPPLPLTVGGLMHARPVAPGFLGLSIEYKAIEQYAGRNPNAINPILVNLIKELSPGQRPELRLGGDSTDRTWWPGPGARKPRGAYIKLNSRWGQIVGAVVRAANARTIIGINLEANDAATARVEARNLIRAIGRHWIEAIELGNEPELYNKFTWYHLPNGQKEPGRGPSYNFYTYLRQYATVSSALPRLPLVGPAVGLPRWTAKLPDFVAAEPRVRIVTLHRYPLQLCYIPPSWPIYPSIAHLLSPRSSIGLADKLAPQVAIAHRAGLPIRIDEINTISCGQAPAVGKSFASALWALNTLFALARVGVDGVNMHTYVGSAYAMFRFHHGGGAWTGQVNPEYYGMLMFAQAAPARARLLTIKGASRARLQAWATQSTGHIVHVVLINDDVRGRILSLRIRGAAPVATTEVLIAPRLTSQTGVTLGGHGFGDRTTTGTLPPPDSDPVTRVRGAFEITVPGASAVMITVKAR